MLVFAYRNLIGFRRIFALSGGEKAFAVLSSFTCCKTSLMRISQKTTVNTVDLNSKCPMYLRVGELSTMIRILINKELILVDNGVDDLIYNVKNCYKRLPK